MIFFDTKTCLDMSFCDGGYGDLIEVRLRVWGKGQGARTFSRVKLYMGLFCRMRAQTCGLVSFNGLGLRVCAILPVGRFQGVFPPQVFGL